MDSIEEVVRVLMEVNNLPPILIAKLQEKRNKCRTNCKSMSQGASKDCTSRCNKWHRLALDRIRGDNGRKELQRFKRKPIGEAKKTDKKVLSKLSALIDDAIRVIAHKTGEDKKKGDK